MNRVIEARKHLEQTWHDLELAREKGTEAEKEAHQVAFDAACDALNEATKGEDRPCL